MTSYAGWHAELYDLFYADKPYEKESGFVDVCLREYSTTTPKRLLEIACGTGRHALAFEKLGYDELRAEQARLREEGAETQLGIGLASFTEAVGAGPSRHYDIAGIKMFDSAELRIHPTGKAILKIGVKTQGQGHETTFAQIVSDALGIPSTDIEVVEGDTDNTPFGLGTYGSRSTPTGGAATAVIAGKLRDKAKQIAAHLLEASPEDIRVEDGRFYVAGSPEAFKTIQDIAFAAYSDLPEGVEPGLEGVHYYDPPEFTAPFGTYAVVVEIDRGTGEWHVRRVVAVDDCGVRINPTIVEGQIMGGLAEGYATAAMQEAKSSRPSALARTGSKSTNHDLKSARAIASSVSLIRRFSSILSSSVPRMWAMARCSAMSLGTEIGKRGMSIRGMRSTVLPWIVRSRNVSWNCGPRYAYRRKRSSISPYRARSNPIRRPRQHRSPAGMRAASPRRVS